MRFVFHVARSLLVATLLVIFSQPALADTITSVSVFSGQFSESFESFPSYVPPGSFTAVPLPEATSIMGGLATVTSFYQGVSGGYVYQFPVVCTPICDFWGLAGAGVAKVADGTKGLGSGGTGGLTIFKFNQGVLRFGGYWGIGAGAGFPDPGQATFTFIDQAGNTIGTATISYFQAFGGTLVWNGFESAVPIYQINVDTHNSTALAVDRLQADAVHVPEASTLLMMVAGICGSINVLIAKFSATDSRRTL